MNLLLSAHADDIAYSLGGALLKGYISQATATLVTVFQRGLYVPYTRPGASVEEASAIRDAEDLAYAAQIGLKHKGLGLRDVTLRGYPDLEDSIFTVTDYRQDPGAVESIETIQSFLDEQIEMTRLWVPLAIGNHIDHVLLLKAVLGWKAKPELEVIFYEDIPYAGFEELDGIETWVQQVIGSAESEIIDISEQFEKKLKNLEIYASQVSQDDIELVKLHARRIVPGLAVERVWRRKKVRRMNVAIATQWLTHMGGSEVLTVATALSVALLGHQVEVIVAEGTIHPKFERQLEHQGIKLVSLASYNTMTEKVAALTELLRRQPPTLVHFIPLESLACAWIETETARTVPVVVTETTNASPSVWWVGDREHHALKAADGIIAMSRQAAANIRRFRGTEKPLQIIPPSLPPLDNRWDPPLMDITDTALNNIGCISRLSEEKGLEFLLAAMTMIHRKAKKITLHIFGEGQERYRVESLIRAFDLDDAVVLHGYVEDMYVAIESCALFVLPSLLEGLPLSLIEIIASGRPFIATNVGGIPELVDGEDWADLVPIGDSRALAEAIEQRMGNPAQLRRDGRRARAAYESCWHSKLRAEQLVQFYEQVLSPEIRLPTGV